MATIVKLGGVELSWVGSGISWSLAYGPGPQTLRIEMPAAVADKIYERARSQDSGLGGTRGSRVRDSSAAEGPISLEIIDTLNPLRSVVQHGLFVVERGPGSGAGFYPDQTSTLTIADRRWLAAGVVVRRSYNVRRDSGDRRLVANEVLDVPGQLGESLADAVFQRGSLNNGSPWTAREVLEDVMREVFGPGGYEVPADVGFVDDIETLRLFDQGDAALARVAQRIPGARFFVDYDGRVKVANVYDLSERSVMDRLPAGYSGAWRVPDRELIVPDGFKVYFDIEAELRFDHVELESDATRTADVPLREERKIENVVINPLLNLPLRNGSSATIGEAVPLQDYLNAINDLRAVDGVGYSDITVAELRKHWMGYWPAFEARVIRNTDSAQISEKWRAILGAIRRDWRSTYRILPQWVDKLRDLSARRVAILDAENAMRAPATVHTQYLQWYTQLAMDPRYNALQTFAVDDYSDDLTADDGTGVSVSPFTVQVLNQGLFRVVPKTDEDGLASTYTLGKGDPDTLPSANIQDANLLRARVELLESFSIAVIMSAIKDTPNGISALWRHDVTLSEAAERLGVTPPIAGRGPYELTSDGLDTARFAWRDDESDRIDQAFWDGGTYPESLLVNPVEVRAVAEAQAARRLVVLMPRARGQVTGPLNPLRPTGNLQQVTHSVRLGSDGQLAEVSTTLLLPEVVEAPSVWSLMPEGARRILRGQVAR